MFGTVVTAADLALVLTDFGRRASDDDNDDDDSALLSGPGAVATCYDSAADGPELDTLETSCGGALSQYAKRKVGGVNLMGGGVKNHRPSDWSHSGRLTAPL